MIYAELGADERQRLRDAYEAGFAAGSGRPWLIPDDPAVIAFVDAVAEDWFLSLETLQILSRFHDPPLAIEEVPGWLREQIALLETAPLGQRREP